jgi:pSer/pThr/pTyr-binding forkhead associated (FHA) protein
MDNESSTGTFVMDEILKKKEKRRIHDGDIITRGATTLILHEKEQNENK